MPKSKKKATRQKQKQKQRQVQNVIVNVNHPKAQRRRSNDTPKESPKESPKPQSSNVSLNMPSHHTFYVESGRPQYHALQAPNNQIEPLRAPNNQIEPLRAPEEEMMKPGRLKPAPPIIRHIPIENEKPKKKYDPFQEELMKRVEKQKEKLEKAQIPVAVAEPLENNSNANPHQGLNISSSSLMTPSQDEQSPIYINNSIAVGGGTDYNSMKVKELQALCKDRGIAYYGSKEDIIQRLIANENGGSYTRKYTKKVKTN